jgi:biopolymer transport protein ExbD
MRLLKPFLKVLLILLLINPLTLNATEKTSKIPVPVSQTPTETKAQVLNNRLIELNETDKSKLSRPDRKQLRKEVQSIKQQLAELDGGIYLSVGALILILILLIILL